MLMISVKAVVDDARRMVDSMTTKNFNFAVNKALTDTAKEAQTQVRNSMPSRFTLRRTWVQKGIRIKAATRNDPVAQVYSIDEFMSRQEGGDNKTPKRDKYIAIPTANVRRNKNDLISKAQFPSKIPNTIKGKNGQMVASITAKDGDKFIVKLKAKRQRTKGDRFTFMYKLARSANMKKRLGLVDTTLNTVKAVFGEKLEAAIAYAIATAKR